MPVLKCPDGKWRIGGGPCVFMTRAAAERAYAAYLAQTHEKRLAETDSVLKAVGLALYFYRKATAGPRALARLNVGRRRMEPSMVRAVSKWMSAVRTTIVSKKPTTAGDVDDLPWAALEDLGRDLLGPVMADAWKVGYQQFRKQRPDPIGVKAKQYAATVGSKMIKEITKETRQAVQEIIVNAVNRGWGPDKTARALRGLVGLTKGQAAAASNSLTAMLDAGVDEATAWAKVGRYAEKLHSQRAVTIARTETNNALRKGIIETMADKGIEKVIWVADPEACLEICAPRDGQEYTIEEYQDIMNPHPRCECSMVTA